MEQTNTFVKENSFDEKYYTPKHKYEDKRIWYKSITPKTVSYFSCKEAFFIPIALSSIVSSLKFAEKILTLEDNWDNNGAEKISSDTWLAAVSFLVKYSETVYTNGGLIIDAPNIYPSASGSIDIDWETETYGLLINIAKGGKVATYYGDDKLEQKTEGIFNPIKFNINLLPKATSFP